jgi:tetratricopeptide (TPR) repeat protein
MGARAGRVVTFQSMIEDRLGPEPMQRAESPPTRHASRIGRHPRIAAVLILVLAAAGGTFAYDRYRVSRLARSVRESFAARRYEEARGPVGRWIRRRPGSGEAQFYRAWLGLVDQQPREAIAGLEEAARLGFDPERLRPLTGIYQARAGRITEAEPILREAFDRQREPRAEVARELARIYLATYRLSQAAEPIERWQTLAPEDPQPYLASNEVASRSAAEPEVQIRNYRAALERDPNLEKARLGLAEQLTKARRFDEAEQQFRAYLARRPGDTAAFVGLGHNAFQSGDLDAATKYFEETLRLDPRQPDALRELAQTDMRLRRFREACGRLELLTKLEPYDHEIRYAYAQALRLAGDEARAKAENQVAARLRNDHDTIIRLRSKIVADPNDRDSRYQVAKWMFDHGHPHEGLKWTKEILRINPNHAPTHQLLADYYEKQGDAGLANYHRLKASSSGH